MDIYYLILIGILLHCVLFLNIDEYFGSQINPPYDLPPGYSNMNYKFKNNKKPISSDTDFCNDNPNCYPCHNWTKIGIPSCTQSVI